MENFKILRFFILTKKKGPITEEITFRTSIISLHLITTHPSLRTLVFLTPLYFGIAHVHHFYEFTLNNPGRIYMGIVRSAVQFTYTTLFGWYAAWLFIRFGSLWVAVVVHSFCNLMGVPRFYGRVGSGATWQSAIYYTLIVGGSIGFYMGLWSWTSSRNDLWTKR